MKKILFFSLILLSSGFVEANEDCNQCEPIKALKQQVLESKIKPDPDNEKTIDKQNAYIDKALDITGLVLKKKPLKQIDISRIVGLLAVVAPYDYECRIGEELYPKIKAEFETWNAEVKRQGKLKIFTKSQMDDLLYCLANGEGVVEKGTDN